MNTLNKAILGITAVAITVACGGNEEQSHQEEIKATTPAFDISQIDSTIMPCEDFEKFAVGNWLKNNPVPESESRWGSFNIVHDANEIKLRAIVEDAVSAKAEKGTPLQQVGDFYASALDSTTVNELRIQPIQPMLDKIEAVSTVQELIEVMAETRKIGSGSMFAGYVGIDAKNSSQYIMHLSQGGLGLPDKTYYTPSDERGENILSEYKKHITAMFVLTGEEKEKSKENTTNIIEIESFLAKNSMDRVERRDPEKTYNKLSVDELQTLCSNIDWKAFFVAAELNGVENLVVGQPDFFKALNNSLTQFPIENWKTYMKWHLIMTWQVI
ncbi:MAG: hypothetical protein JKY30_13615 [Flavobacteriales bacterium]|nr:hypothetical protein [Flavobacteriales bacterium]